MTVPKIRQYYIEIQERRKFDVLTRLLDIESPELAIVFGRTKRRVDELTEALNLRGYAAEGIHGDLSQAKRMSVLRKFKEGTIEILVATDVAARVWIFRVLHMYLTLIFRKIQNLMYIVLVVPVVQEKKVGQLHLLHRVNLRS